MGFRLIKKSSPAFAQQKKAQLIKEAMRWRHLTTRSEDDPTFLAQYEKAESHMPSQKSSEDLVAAICQTIRSESINIAAIQGNLEIDRVHRLLADSHTSK